MRIEHFLQAVNYQINESSNFLWRCFGDGVKLLDTVVLDEGISASCTFHPTTRKVFSIELWCDCVDANLLKETYTWIDPEFLELYKEEHLKRGVALDDIVLPLEDILTKIRQAFRTEIETLDVNIDPELHLELFKLAHERDISFNEYIVEILRKQIDNLGENNNE